MTAERYDYYQSQQQKNMAAHRTPISAAKMASEAENHAKDGPCKVIALPNLPSVGGRVKYAMGAMTANQFSQRCGVSEEWLFKDSGLETSKYQRDYINSIIEKAKNEMESKNLSYEKIAEQIMCSQSSIYKWIHGQGVPKDESVEKIERYFKHCEVPMMEKAKNNDCKQNACNAPFGTHLHFEGVYSGDVLSALVSVLKGTYRVNLTIDEVGAET